MESGVDCKGIEWIRISLDNIKADISGVKSGMLTVLFPVKKLNKITSKKKLANGVTWLCQCECGNQTVVYRNTLGPNGTKSCGCAKAALTSESCTKNYMFYPGDQIECWTVLGKADGFLGRGAHWRVKCVCGKESIVNGQSLRNGHSGSCGCRVGKLVSERSLNNLIGHHRGMLTVIDGPIYRYKHEIHWLAQCECGNTCEINGQAFRRGEATSCGCQNYSSGEALVASILNGAGVKFKNEYVFDDLVGLNGQHYRYDFALLDNENKVTRLIEFDGGQHFKPVDFFGGEENFERIRMHDKIKNDYAKDHDIPLVRIPNAKRRTLCLEDLCGEEFLVA